MLPKKDPVGVHHAGAGIGARDSSTRWLRAGTHSRDAIGLGFLLATAFEVRSSSDRFRQSATFEDEVRGGVTN